jgi:hypothetical protein
MSKSDRFIDNEDGTLTDTQTTLTWFLEDGWQREAKWFTWDEAHDLAIDMNAIKFCSFQDWRIPLEDEIRTLYNPEVINHDKYEKENHLETVFPPGGQSTVWLKGEGGSYGTLFDFKNGEVRPIYKSKSGRMSVRFVRGNLPNA